MEATHHVDPELPYAVDESINLQRLSWRGVSVTVTDRTTKQAKVLIDNVSGLVKAGECCAIMGPSGSGKTTLLNVLAKQPARSCTVEGKVLINGKQISASEFRRISSFVQNQEPLIGALTVSGTLHFASRLAGPKNLSKRMRKSHIDSIVESFGLTDQAAMSVGSPFRKSLSDGQKRRVTVARQLVTFPKILFLDEPTSGLDSAASFEIIQYLCALAKSQNLIVVCSIHQPSATIFNMFDKLALLSLGKLLYFGPVVNVSDYFTGIDVEIPTQVDLAEFLLDLVNTDFAHNKEATASLLQKLQSSWTFSTQSKLLLDRITDAERSAEPIHVSLYERPGSINRLITLMQRDLVKMFRDPLAYGIRLAFVLSFAILLGTVWFRLDLEQSSAQSLSGVIFFSICFISLAAIIYAPAFIEDYISFQRDYRNGFYGPLEFSLSNLIMGIPYLAISSLLFCIITYWMSNPLRDVAVFFNWVLWIFMTSFAAEALIILIVIICPNFMFAIACGSFVNSLLLCTEGFFITSSQLNAFYKYGFYYWNYLTYSFRGIMVKQFAQATYSCGQRCQCLYDSTLAQKCQLTGEAILQHYGFGVDPELGKNIGIVIAIGLGYRLVAFLLLLKKH